RRRLSPLRGTVLRGLQSLDRNLHRHLPRRWPWRPRPDGHHNPPMQTAPPTASPTASLISSVPSHTLLGRSSSKGQLFIILPPHQSLPHFSLPSLLSLTSL